MSQFYKWRGRFSFLGVCALGLFLANNLQAQDYLSQKLNSANADDLVRSCIATVQRDCEKWAAEGGGSDAPRLKGGTHVELAMGEKYILIGTISNEAGDILLNIDLKKQPWLANRTRVKNPFYRINDSAVNWRPFLGRQVTLVATARYAAWIERSNGRQVLEIYLDANIGSVIDAFDRR